MSTLSLVLFVLAAYLVLLQAIMFAAWVTAILTQRTGTVTVRFWPLLVAVALAVAGVLLR